MLSLSCTDAPASLQKELGHLERLRGGGGRGPWEERDCWRVNDRKGEDTIPWEYVDGVMEQQGTLDERGEWGILRTTTG